MFGSTIFLIYVHLFVNCVFFFFSSRRRHTRLVSDWSSDVCSSDLCWRSTPGKIAAIFSGLLLLASIPVGLLAAVFTWRSETMHNLVQNEVQEHQTPAAAVAFSRIDRKSVV